MMLTREDPKEKQMRQALLDNLKLTARNREIADKYLDMAFPEDRELLSEVERQDLSSTWRRSGDYVERLQKKKRTEELGRYLRFLVQVGGAQTWNYFVNEGYRATSKELERTLPLLDGEKAEAQRLAVWGGLCTAALSGFRPAETKALCLWGKERQALFPEAMELCFDHGKQYETRSGKRIRLLLAAAYLYHAEPGTERQTVEYLKAGLIGLVPAAVNLAGREREDMLSYVRNAGGDTPFPGRLVPVLKGKRGGINRGQTALIAGCAFLAIRHDVRFEILLRLTAAVDIAYEGRENTALKICKGISDEAWFDARMAEIEGMLPMPDDDYMIWCMRERYDRGAERMAANCPEAVRAAGERMESEDYEELTERVREANPALYEELQASYREVFRGKSAKEISRNVYPGQDEAAGYLLGTCAPDTLETFLPEWGSCDYLSEQTCRKIEKLREAGESSMYRRALILEALRKEACYFRRYRVAADAEDSRRALEDIQDGSGAIGQTPETAGRTAEDSLLTEGAQIRAMLRIMETEALPVRLIAEALGGLWNGLKEKQEKAAFMELCAESVAEKLRGIAEDRETEVKETIKSWETGLEEAMAGGSHAACCLGLSVFARFGGEYRDRILSCAGNAAKQVQTLLLQICGEHREWAPEVLALLGSKKVKERESAALTVEKWGDAALLPRIREAQEKEKNKKLCALLAEVAEELETEAAMAEEAAADPAGQRIRELERSAAGILRGALKRKVEWVRDLGLPEVHFQDGRTASADYMLAIPAAYADMDTPGVNETAAGLAEVLDRKEFCGYICALYEGWLAAGGEAKKRWVLYAFSLHGGAESVPVLYKQIGVWAEHSRGAMAAEAVHALVLNGSQEALLYVDQMSRKYKNRQVKNAAASALESAAEQLHISREELGDRLVPDLGFDEKMEQVFDYGSRSFTVRLQAALEVEVYDGNGKRLKNMLAPGKQDDPDKAGASNNAFKQMKRQLKTVTASQKARLEQALASARLWPSDRWQALFVKNPIMHLFATQLIWGVYENGRLKDTFRYMEDGSFNTVDEDEYALPGEGMIGLVHPLELTEETCAAWKEQLSDYEVVQPFAQLERPVYRMTEEEKGEKAFQRFYGSEINGRSLSARLLAAGWTRGEILDAGFFTNFYRSDGNMGAELTFSGFCVGYEDEEVTVSEMYFYRLPDEDMDEDGESRTWRLLQEKNRCLLFQVSPRYFSEVVLQAARAAGIAGPANAEGKDGK